MEVLPQDKPQEKERKFTFLHLEIRPLDGWDIFVLSFFALIIGLHFTIAPFNRLYRLYSLVTIPMFYWYLIASTPFGLRFRNVYFFMPWIVLSGLFLLDGTSMSYYPILIFLLYQYLRLFFWRNYHKEFIPFTVGRGHYYRYRSNKEGRSGGERDKSLMVVLFWVGLILLFVCYSGLIGTKI